MKYWALGTFRLGLRKMSEYNSRISKLRKQADEHFYLTI